MLSMGTVTVVAWETATWSEVIQQGGWWVNNKQGLREMVTVYLREAPIPNRGLIEQLLAPIFQYILTIGREQSLC